jgi:NitT/TauT family transport system substrate-binding protein
MLHRRRALQCGVAALGSLSAVTSCARAQRKPLTKIRYNEVVRSIFYAPAYVAMTKGFFEELGLDITMATAQGGDKSMAALIGGGADIAADQ